MKNLQIDKEKLLNAISDVQSMFIQDKSIKEVFNQMLAVLLDITKSEYGFIGEIFNDGNRIF
jgi:two-component system, NtrC family, sensor kinase